MTPERLGAWDALARRRHGEALARPWRWLRSPIAAGLLLGALAAGGLAFIAHEHGAQEAHTTWALATATALAGVILRAPFRMFWRSDATLHARLPIAGAALYRLATRRSLRAGSGVALALCVALVPLAVSLIGTGQETIVAALAVGVWLAAAAAALATPPIGTLAGALVGDRTVAKGLGVVTGEGAPPPVIFLSLLPALGGGIVGLGGFVLADFALGQASAEASPAAPGVLAAATAALAVAPLLWLAGRGLAARALSTATREVAALDAIKLAHVELDRARGPEALWARTAGAGAPLYRKDVALARRRYPLFFGAAALGSVALWIVALAAGPTTCARWAIWGAVVLSAHLAVFGGRMGQAPIERLRLVRTLPFTTGTALRAKWSFLLWRALVVAAAAGPAAVRSDRPAATVGAVAAAALLGLVGGGATMARRVGSDATGPTSDGEA